MGRSALPYFMQFKAWESTEQIMSWGYVTGAEEGRPDGGLTPVNPLAVKDGTGSSK